MVRYALALCLITAVGACTYKPETLAINLGAGSSLTVFPTSAPADGVSVVTVTATLQHFDSTPAANTPVVLTLSDPNDQLRSVGGPLEPNSTLTTDANGQVTATLASRVIGTKTITCAARYNGAIVPVRTAQVSFTQVLHYPSFALSVDNPNTAAGSPVKLTITSLNDQNVVATNYTGTVLLSASDPNAILPATVQFTAQNQGSQVISGIVFKKAQVTTLSAQDANYAPITGATQVQVNPGPLGGFVFSLPGGTPVAGTPVDLEITALDAYGNTETDYVGPADITSNASSAFTNISTSFVGGQVTLPQALTVDTPNSITLTATDTSTGTASSQVGFPVQAAGANRLVVTIDGNTSIPAGGTATFTVSVIDAYGNAVTQFADPVRFTSSDPRAQLPATYTFDATADAGSHTFSAILNSVNTATTITAIDAAGAAKPANGSATVTVYATGPYFTGTWSGSDTITAGAGATLVVRALDASGTQLTGCSGQVEFSSTDPNAALPGPATLSNNCQVSVPNFVFTTAKTSYVLIDNTGIAAGDPSMSGTSHELTVQAGPVTQYLLGANPNSVTAGQRFALTVSAEDAYGNVNGNYTGNANITSDDVSAAQSYSATFAANQAGVAHVTMQLDKAGTRTVTATDNGNATITGTLSVPVVAGAATKLHLAPSVLNPNAGDSITVVVTAVDNYGNTDTTYAGKVTWDTTSPNAIIPVPYTFVPSTDAGTHSFPGIELTTATGSGSTVTLNVTDSANLSGSSPPMTVKAGPASKFDFLLGTGTVVAGVPFHLRVYAVDNYDNAADTNTLLVVRFSTSDPNTSGLPTPLTQILNNGSGDFNITLFQANPAATVSVVSQFPNAGLTGTLTALVSPGAAKSLALTNLASSSTAGAGLSFSVTAYDAFNNQASGYNDAVHISAADPCSTPFNYTFITADAGSHSFGPGGPTLTLGKAGSWNVVVQDTMQPSLEANQTVSVTAGSATGLTVSGFPSNPNAGDSNSITVGARDAYGNPTNYAGSFTLTSSDGQATLPSGSITFNNPNTTVSGIVLKTAGSETITATSGSLSGTQTVNVKPGAASVMSFVSPPSSEVAGVAFALTTQIKDSYNNIATGYTGTVQLSASPNNGATMPAPHTFNSIDAGQHTFSGISLSVVQATTILAQDGASAALHTSQAINVTPGDPNHLLVSGFPSPVKAGVAGNATVTAQDRFNNTCTQYTGTVHFSSNDIHAQLPATYTFNGGDAGSHVFSVTLQTLTSNANITATDTNGITGNENSINVTAGPVTQLAINANSTWVAGVGQSITVSAEDQFGNIVTSDGNAFSITSSDPNAVLPAPRNLVNGTATFAGLILKTAGSQTITATATGSGGATGSTSVTVAPNMATQLAFITQPPSSAQACGPLSPAPVVAIQDSYGNTCTQNSNQVVMTSNAGHVLVGQVQINAVNGVATFNNIGLTQTGSTIILTAAGIGVGATSNPITTTNAAPPQFNTMQVSGTSSSCMSISAAVSSLCKVSTSITWKPTSSSSFKPVTLAASSPLGYGPVQPNGLMTFVWDSEFDIPRQNLGVTLSMSVTTQATGPTGNSTALQTTSTNVTNQTFFNNNTALLGGTSGIEQIATADFDLDGIADLVYVDGSSLYLSLDAGAPSVIASNSPVAVAAGDVNSDGLPDAVICTNSAAYYAAGTGTGLSSTVTALPLPGCLNAWVMDINRDGINDVVGTTSSSVAWALGTAGSGYGSVAQQLFNGFSVIPGAISADWNADGWPDLMLMGASTGNALFVAGTGNGFDVPVSVATSQSQIQSLAAGDVNHDGKTDLAAATNAGLALFTNTASSWSSNLSSNITGSPILLVDVNNDSYPDLLAGSGSGLTLYFNSTSGTFSAGVAAGTVSSQAPQALVAASLHANGLQDVVAGAANGSLTLYKNATPASCTWNMQTVRALPAGQYANSLAVADFDEDGKLDVVVSRQAGAASSLLLARGDGARGFVNNGNQVPLINTPGSISAADFDGDGHQDIAAPVAFQKGVVIAYGDGHGGTRPSPYTVATGGSPQAVVGLDMNADGWQDIVVADANKAVSMWFGPSFIANTSVIMPGSLNSLTVVANDPNYPDIIAWSTSSTTLYYLNNNAGAGLSLTGTFAFSFGSTPIAMVAAQSEFGSGNPNFFANVAASPNTLAFIPITAAGTFGAASYSQLGCPITGLSVADFDQQLGPDLAVSCSSGAQDVYVLFNNGSLGIQNVAGYYTAHAPGLSVPADFNGDGYPDVINLNNFSGNSTATLATNTRSSTFYGADSASSTVIGLNASPGAMHLADINRDGTVDVLTNNNPDALDLYLGRGDGSISAEYDFSPNGAGLSMAAADVDDNGTIDVLAANGNNVLFYKNTTPATSTTPQLNNAINIPLTAPPLRVVTADLDRNGVLDIIAATSAGVEVAMGAGSPVSYASSVAYTAGGPGQSVAVRDINHDGYPDAIVTHGATNKVSLLMNAGNGTFSAAQTIACAGCEYPWGVALGDLNRDGQVDAVVVLAGASTTQLVVAYSLSSTGTSNVFGTPIDLAISPGAQEGGGVSIADLNGDGYPDIIVPTLQDFGVAILLNQGGSGKFAPPKFLISGSGARGAAVADVNNDGRPDIAVIDDADQRLGLWLADP